MYTEKFIADISNPYGYVYVTTNLVTGKKYCGKHKSSKYDPSYLGSGVLLKQAITQYGADYFKSAPIEWATSAEELHQKEVSWIQRLDAVNSDDWYNLIDDSNQYPQQKIGPKMILQRKVVKEYIPVYYDADTGAVISDLSPQEKQQADAEATTKFSKAFPALLDIAKLSLTMHKSTFALLIYILTAMSFGNKFYYHRNVIAKELGGISCRDNGCFSRIGTTRFLYTSR